MVKIRLARAGAKKRPFYRIVAIDERDRRDGRPLELLGTFDPLANPERIKIRFERLESWISKGAQMTDSVRALVRRAPRESGDAAGAASASAPGTA